MVQLKSLMRLFWKMSKDECTRSWKKSPGFAKPRQTAGLFAGETSVAAPSFKNVRSRSTTHEKQKRSLRKQMLGTRTCGSHSCGRIRFPLLGSKSGPRCFAVNCGMSSLQAVRRHLVELPQEVLTSSVGTKPVPLTLPAVLCQLKTQCQARSSLDQGASTTVRPVSLSHLKLNTKALSPRQP